METSYIFSNDIYATIIDKKCIIADLQKDSFSIININLNNSNHKTPDDENIFILKKSISSYIKHTRKTNSKHQHPTKIQYTPATQDIRIENRSPVKISLNRDIFLALMLIMYTDIIFRIRKKSVFRQIIKFNYVKNENKMETSDYIKKFNTAILLYPFSVKCLVKSISLSLYLQLHGLNAKTVIGVQLYPFTSHAWNQLGDLVLNDELAHIRRFRPIYQLGREPT